MTNYQFNTIIAFLRLLAKGIGFILAASGKNRSDFDIAYRAYNEEINKLQVEIMNK